MVELIEKLAEAVLIGSPRLGNGLLFTVGMASAVALPPKENVLPEIPAVTDPLAEAEPLPTARLPTLAREQLDGEVTVPALVVQVESARIGIRNAVESMEMRQKRVIWGGLSAGGYVFSVRLGCSPRQSYSVPE